MNKQDSLSLINDPLEWAAWPMLPLLFYKDGLREQIGFLFVGRGAKVFLGNVFEMVDMAQISTLSTVIYDSFEVMLESGWIID